MRILLVSDYATLSGGAEIYLGILRDGLRRRGHDVRIFASSARPSHGPSIADYECLGTTSRFRTLLQTANASAYRRLRQTLADFRPDVVHVKLFLTQLSPLIQPLLRDVPSLYHVVWYRAVCPIGTKRLPDGRSCDVSAGIACHREGCLPVRDWLPLMLQMRLFRHWLACFDLLVANGEAVRRRLLEAGIGPVEVVWNGVPVGEPRPALAGPPAAAFAGRLVPEKGADILVRAFANVVERLPRACLLVAGDGPERGGLERLVDELGLGRRVLLLGHLPPSELQRQLAASWVQVVPSLWDEPFGNAAAEALMRGTAVIGSGSGGLSEIVRDGKTGLLVPPGDVEALATALITILSRRELAEAMGRDAREDAIARFNEDAFVEGFLAAYRKLV